MVMSVGCAGARSGRVSARSLLPCTLAFLPLSQGQLKLSWNQNLFNVCWYGVPTIYHPVAEKVFVYF
jgi:hypothetical protein